MKKLLKPTVNPLLTSPVKDKIKRTPVIQVGSALHQALAVKLYNDSVDADWVDSVIELEVMFLY